MSVEDGRVNSEGPFPLWMTSDVRLWLKELRYRTENYGCDFNNQQPTAEFEYNGRILNDAGNVHNKRRLQVLRNHSWCGPGLEFNGEFNEIDNCFDGNSKKARKHAEGYRGHEKRDEVCPVRYSNNNCSTNVVEFVLNEKCTSEICDNIANTKKVEELQQKGVTAEGNVSNFKPANKQDLNRTYRRYNSWDCSESLEDKHVDISLFDKDIINHVKTDKKPNLQFTNIKRYQSNIDSIKNDLTTSELIRTEFGQNMNKATTNDKEERIYVNVNFIRNENAREPNCVRVNKNKQLNRASSYYDYSSVNLRLREQLYDKSSTGENRHRHAYLEGQHEVTEVDDALSRNLVRRNTIPDYSNSKSFDINKIFDNGIETPVAPLRKNRKSSQKCSENIYENIWECRMMKDDVAENSSKSSKSVSEDSYNVTGSWPERDYGLYYTESELDAFSLLNDSESDKCETSSKCFTEYDFEFTEIEEDVDNDSSVQFCGVDRLNTATGIGKCNDNAEFLYITDDIDLNAFDTDCLNLRPRDKSHLQNSSSNDNLYTEIDESNFQRSFSNNNLYKAIDNDDIKITDKQIDEIFAPTFCDTDELSLSETTSENDENVSVTNSLVKELNDCSSIENCNWSFGNTCEVIEESIDKISIPDDDVKLKPKILHFENASIHSTEEFKSLDSYSYHSSRNNESEVFLSDSVSTYYSAEDLRNPNSNTSTLDKHSFDSNFDDVKFRKHINKPSLGEIHTADIIEFEIAQELRKSLLLSCSDLEQNPKYRKHSTTSDIEQWCIGLLDDCCSEPEPEMEETSFLSLPTGEQEFYSKSESASPVLLRNQITDRTQVKSLIEHARYAKSPTLSSGSLGSFRVVKEGTLERSKIIENGKKGKKSWTSDAYACLTDQAFILLKDKATFHAMKTGTKHLSPEVCLNLNNARYTTKTDLTSKKNILLITDAQGTQVLVQDDSKHVIEEWQKEISTVLSRLTNTRPVTMQNFEKSFINQDQLKIKNKLKKFFGGRRPSVEDLVKSGIYKDEPIFGSYLETVCETLKPKVPLFVQHCIKAIEPHMDTDGLYRASGNLSQVQRIRLQVDQGNLSEVNTEKTDIHVLTGALKLFFRELKIPLIPCDKCEAVVKACDQLLTPTEMQVPELQRIIKTLPEAHRDTLSYLLKHLVEVSKHGQENRMDVPNLAIVWGPSLLWTDTQATHNILYQCTMYLKVIETMLYHYDDIFI